MKIEMKFRSIKISFPSVRNNNIKPKTRNGLLFFNDPMMIPVNAYKAQAKETDMY